jgi:hypothetical protein
MTAPGKLPAIFEATVPGEGPLALELREPEGTTVDVEVVNAEGRPVPFARIDFATARSFDVTGRVQRVDSYTDALGHRRFSRVQPGPQRVHASMGSREGETHADFRDGDRASVRVVVR